MILLRDYNREKKLDRVWYKSSSILYSECEDKENDLKTLRITYRNGYVYEYYDVDVNDYIFFLYGGLDGSNGRTLNNILRKKLYLYQMIGKVPIEKVNEEFEKEKERQMLEKKKREESNTDEKDKCEE